MTSKNLCKLVLVLSTFVCTNAFAGGYFVGDLGTKGAGRGGAFVAKADDPTAVEYNPAGLARQRGWAIYLGNRFGYANELYTRAPTFDWGSFSGTVPYVEFDTVQNETPWQLLGPMLVVTSDFGLEDWGFAAGVYSPPGVSSAEFPMDGGQRYMMTTRDVKILNYTISAAWKHKEIFGIGATLQWIDLASLKFGLVADGNTIGGEAYPVSSPLDIATTLEGADHFSMTTIVGAWLRPCPFYEIAISGRVIPVTMVADTTLDVSIVNENLQDEEVLLIRDGVLANNVTLSLPLAPALRAGARYIHLDGKREVFDIEFDVGVEFWSYVDRFEMKGNGLVAQVMGQNIPIESIIMEKQWQTAYTFRLGGDYNLIPDKLSLRTGVFYETSAAKREYANVDFFNSNQLGASLGASVILKKLELSLTYTYLYQFPFTVTEGEGKVYQQVPGSYCEPPYDNSGDIEACNENYLGQPSPTVNGGTYSADYSFLALSGTYRF